MNVLDIILALVLVWALISGLRKGLISQATALVGLLLGTWLASNSTTVSAIGSGWR